MSKSKLSVSGPDLQKVVKARQEIVVKASTKTKPKTIK